MYDGALLLWDAVSTLSYTQSDEPDEKEVPAGGGLNLPGGPLAQCLFGPGPPGAFTRP